jgi:hypothetical protein
VDPTKPKPERFADAERSIGRVADRARMVAGIRVIGFDGSGRGAANERI